MKVRVWYLNERGDQVGMVFEAVSVPSFWDVLREQGGLFLNSEHSDLIPLPRILRVTKV